MMTYKILINGVQTHQADDYKESLNIVLQTNIEPTDTLELFYENIMMFRINGNITALDMVKDFQKHLSRSEEHTSELQSH